MAIVIDTNEKMLAYRKAMADGNTEEAERLRDEWMSTIRDGVNAANDNHDKIVATVAAKPDKKTMKKAYTEMIALYRDSVNLLLSSRKLKKEMREAMAKMK